MAGVAAEKNMNKKTSLIVFGAALILGLMIVSIKIADFVLDEIADRAIHKILSEPESYSPYGPRANPDKYPFQNIKNPSTPQSQKLDTSVRIGNNDWERNWQHRRSGN